MTAQNQMGRSLFSFFFLGLVIPSVLEQEDAWVVGAWAGLL